MTHPIIATPHGFEAVEAVVQYADSDEGDLETARMTGGWVTYEAVEWFPAQWEQTEKAERGEWLVKHLNGEVTVHDTDPRIEPTYPDGAWGYRGHLGGEWLGHPESWAREIVAANPKNTLLHQPHYPVTIDGQQFTLVGEWVEVADA